MLMKDKFLSKAVPRGTRTIWRYLSALILLFSLSIGQMWAEDTVFKCKMNGSVVQERNDGNSGDFFSFSFSSGSFGWKGGTDVTGCTYDGVNYTSAMKFDSKPTLSFTTTKKATIIVVQSTSKNSSKAPKFDGTAMTSKTEISGANVWTITDVDAGSHNVRYSSEIWIHCVYVVYPAPAVNYTVTIDPNGGAYAEDPDGWTKSAGVYTKSIASGTSFTAPAGLTKGTDDLSWKDGDNNDITFPVSITGDITFVAQWAPHAASSDATLSALSIAGCTLNETFDPATTAYTITLPFYGAMPVVGDVTATKNDANAKTPVVSISSNVITVACEAEDGTKLNYTIAVTISPAPTASSSINIEQLVLDNGKSYNIGAALDAAHIGYVDKDALDSLSNKTGRNEPYLGLKFKKTTSKVTIVVPASTELKVKFGYVDGSAGLKVSVNGSDPAAPSLTDGVYTLAASAGVKEVVFTQTGAKTVVYKQIMVGEAIKSVQLPWLVTYDAGEHGTCSTAKEVWWGTALTLPSLATLEDGWSFDGWNDGANTYVAGASYNPTADVTLTAQYTALASPFDLTSLTYKIGTGAATNVGYVDGTFTYNIVLPYTPSYDAITVTPVLKEATSSLKGDEVLTVSSLPGAATFTVVEAGGASEQLYTVNFSKEPKDGVEIIKAVTANATVTGLIGGTRSTNLTNGDAKKLDKNKYFGATLASGNFQTGDVMKINITTADNNGGKCFVYADEAGTDLIYEAPAVFGSTGVYEIVLPAAVEGKNSLYLYRADGDVQWNPSFSYIAVYRPMNPVLTAITIDGRDGEIDALDDKHFSVTIPYEADLAALTVVPTIVRNAAHPTTPEAVISNAGAWIEGDNTYRVMDKDGDYTDYTITLDRDVLKHTVSFNTHGGTAVASEEVVHGEYLAAAPAAPTKDENVFKFWSETEDGAEVDVTTVQINADKEFHAVWEAEPAGIKLFNGNVLNTTNFISAAATTIEISEVEYPCLVAFNSNRTSLAGAKQGDLVMYSATTDAAKIKFDLYNANGSAKTAYVWLVEEGDDAATQLDAIEIAGETRVKTAYYEFNGTKNRTVYLTSGAKADIKVLQAKVIESGSAIKQFGQAGYSLNLNKGRVVGAADATVSFEGAAITIKSEYAVLSSGSLSPKTYIQFNNAVANTIVKIKRSGSNKYYVTNNLEDKGTEYSTDQEITLTATGTWYIGSVNSGSPAQLTKIEFLAPKCEQPTITPMSNSDLCEGDDFAPLTVSATVSDEGTLHYAWFKEAGETDEAVGTDATSYTPEADGEYYVIVTNRKDGFSDNSATSNTITVEHFASAVITSAPMNQRAEAGNAVTLTVAATGKNVAYKWYTCDNEAGDNPEAIVPAETNASLNITVTAGMNQWYKVVVSSDCGSDVFATARVSVFQPTTPATVTESIVWDWTSSVWPASGTAAFTNEDAPDYELLADADAIVPNAEGFRSDMLYGKGQYVWRSGNKFFQGTAIKFTTTVAGAVRVYFRSTGSGKTVNVAINGTDAGSRTNSFGWSSYVEVPAGEVEMICTGDGYTRIQKIEFLEEINRREAAWVAPGELGTVCLKDNAKALGAKVFEVMGCNASGYMVFDEILSGEIEAGKPYLFEVTRNGSVAFFKTVGATHTETAESDKGMIGTFDGETLHPGTGNYCYFSGRHIWRVNDFSVDITVPAYCCYVDYDEFKNNPISTAAPAPGRRRVVLGVNGKDEAQGFEDLDASEKPLKVMIDGTLYIIRGEKVFDATGRLVK